MWRQLVGRSLRRFDLKVVSFSGTYVARRNALLRSSGVETLLDIGANTGQYGTLVRYYGYAGRLLSIEPLSGAFQQLSSRAAADPAWDVERRAVGAAPGTIDINVSDDSIWSSALPLLSAANDWNARSRYLSKETVEAETVDGIVARHAFDPARLGVKVDVQGLERDVLEGASQTIQSIPYLEIELSARPFYEGQMLLLEALAAMAAARLTLVLIEPLGSEPATGRAMQFDGIFVRI